MTEEKDIALVSDYLEGKLGTEEKKEVEKRLAEESDFKALFEDLKLLTNGIGQLNHRPVLKRIDNLEKDLGNPLEEKAETKTVFWSFKRLAAAFIGLAIVAFASWYGLSGNGKVDAAALYSEYYVAYDNSIVPITRGDVAENLIQRAFQAYERQEYLMANGLFNELVKLDDRLFVKFYAGITAMEVENYDKAASLFTLVISQQADFSVQAQWYLALNYLKQEDYENTIQVLEKLGGGESSFSLKAKELLKEIE